MNQCDRILKYMNDFGSITTLQAFTDLGCTRLASRITDLRHKGIDIKSEYVSGKNRYGEKVSYKKYSLAEKSVS
ncbi:MAG: helix-turn-helix domain-containing protein [Clostridia bacterium]|nr:helix-turn-helix domain-containing protein [Clostridia bacterium]